MKLAAIRGAMAGCVGSLVLVAVLILVPSPTEGVGEIDRSLERSGVVVVDGPSTSSRPFEDPAGSLRLAGLSLAYGLAAGALVGLGSWRFGRIWAWHAVGLGVALAVLLATGNDSGGPLGSQVGFWAVCGIALGRLGVR